MEKKLIVSPSPHIHSGNSTQRLMWDVIIALIPAFIVSVVFYGLNAVTVTAISIVTCLLTEYVITRFLLGRNSTLSDYSAALTGFLLAFNLPPTIPWWIVVIGAVVSIGVGKMSFGGLGRNPFNPALVGRVFLLISFPMQMATFAAPSSLDATSGATPLAIVKAAAKNHENIADLMTHFSYSDMLVGNMPGSLGEVAALALIFGFIYLLIRRVITWHIPVYVIGTMVVFSGILWLVDPSHFADPLFHVLTGGALLGAIFMATDYVTSPMTKGGMLFYGIGIGVITILIRTWGAYPEGVSFAILIMNATVPLINKYSHPKRFGKVVTKKA
ncbi:MAG: RnfABCDGE type electron transport complex subunit D [Rikenellaceae bacterium]|nr:RnfABCDGE type electron transport complex subunit D [Rikenellaceae bacterium]